MPYYGIHLEDNDKILYLSGVETEKSTIPFDFITSGKYVWSDEGDITGAIIETEMHPTSLYRLFYNCANMSFIRGLEKIDTSNVTTMKDTFLGCKSLKTLYLKMWDTSNVTVMDNMFQLCTSLKNINIDGWNTDKVTKFSLMFYNCTSLETIYCSQTWKGASPVSGMMFERCFALGWGTLGSNLDYANPTENGYFTIPSKAAYFAPESDNDQEAVHAVRSMYLGDENNIAAKVKKVYLGDANGVARLWWAGFPAEPTEYLPIDKYTASQTWIAPESGWFKIEVHGASGNGGLGANTSFEVDGDGGYYVALGGGSGAGGGYGCSLVKLSAGDIVTLNIGAVGADTVVEINSSMESYDTIVVSPGGNGGNAVATAKDDVGAVTPSYSGAAGVAGTVTGGNLANIQGGNGTRGSGTTWATGEENYSPVAGGKAAHSDGNAGGRGAGVYRSIAVSDAWTGSDWLPYKRTFGKAGFIKISRGNTNVAG